nr:hypothetical protein [Tanacetum cinerariifolium]
MAALQRQQGPARGPAHPEDDDEEEEESFGDDVDDEEEDKEEEEEHPASADSIPPPVHRVTARMYVRAHTPISLPSETEGYRAAMIRMRAESPSTSHPLPSSTPPSGTPPLLPKPFPTSSPPLLLPSTSRRADVLEITLPAWKRLCIALGLRFEVSESSSAPTARPTGGFRADYGFVGTLDDEIRRDPEREVGLSQRMTDFVTTVRQDTDEIYGRLNDAHDDRLLMSGQLNMMCRDRRAHARTARLMENEARLSHEAWVQSMDASDTARAEVISLRTTVLAQQTKITGLRAADHSRLVEALTLLKTLQTRMAALQRQQGPARGPAHPEKMEPKSTRSTPATTTTTTTTHVTNAQLNALIDQGVVDALVARDADRSRNGKDSHDSGTGVRRQAPPPRECTYQDFMKCQPLYFKGTEGVVELTQRFERNETVFHISNCTVENQIKFAICTLLESALTWWNSHVKTVGPDVAYAMTWTNLKKKMTDKMFPEELDKIERYIGGLPDMIHESVMASKEKTMQDAIEFTTEMMDKKINTFAERQAKNKRKAYTAGSGDKKAYGGSKPLCSKCNYHHDGQCAPKCYKCSRVGHLARDCRSTANANTANNQRGTRTGKKPTCFECGAQGHFKRECPKLKNNNRGNPAGNGNALAKVYNVGHAGTNPDSNIVMGTFLLNNRYASILFDTGADRSFVSTEFSSQVYIAPTT